MTYEVGMRVIAIRDGGDGQINSYGTGTYVGDLPTSDTPDDYTRKLIEETIAAEDSKPVEEHWQVEMFDHFMEKGVSPKAGTTHESIIADVEAERALDHETRIRKRWALICKNPCIHLDNGSVVWGKQCWWGPEDQLKKKYEDQEWVEVPVPDGNGTWKDA